MVGSTAEAEALTERLLAAGERAPAYAPWLDRRPGREIIAGQGLPRYNSEGWRHTNPRRWYAAALAEDGGAPEIRVQAPAGVEIAPFDAAAAAQLADRHRAGVVDLTRHPLAAVSRLLLGAGVVIHAPEGTQATAPVRIEGLGAAHQHVIVLVGPRAALTVVEEPSTFVHRLVECVVGVGARLTHLRRQAASDRCECSLVAVAIAAEGGYDLAQVSRGAALRRNELVAQVDGPQAHVRIRAAWLLDGGEHLDNQTRVSHAVGGGVSRQRYRGVAGGRSRAVQSGTIHIAPRAGGTEATFTAKNLLTSAGAQVFAKPALEIHASDVKCSHGATVGALDAAAIHYLRSRGIGEQAARALLVRGFLSEAIGDDEGARRLGLV